MSTGLPIEISSSMKGQSYISFCRLDIDIHRYDMKFRKIQNAVCLQMINHCCMHSYIHPSIQDIHGDILFQGHMINIVIQYLGEFYGLIILYLIFPCSWFLNGASLNLLGISLTFIYMKNGITRSDGVELKFKLSLREIGQLTVYVIHVFIGVSYLLNLTVLVYSVLCDMDG